eukprot:PITA_34401
MMGKITTQKYVDPGSPIVKTHINGVEIPNTLIDVGAAINIMSRQTMEQLKLPNLLLTPTLLQLADRSIIKPDGVLEDISASLDSWEYPVDFMILTPKTKKFNLYPPPKAIIEVGDNEWVDDEDTIPPVFTISKISEDSQILNTLENFEISSEYDHTQFQLDSNIEYLSSRQMSLYSMEDFGSSTIEIFPETKAILSATENSVVIFLYEDIFTRFGVPREIVTDQGSRFTSNMVEKLMEEYKIKHRKSTPYHPQANGQVEYTNKVIESIITKIVHLHRRDWAERLPEALWAYKTTWRNTTGHSPYELVYGKEVLFPIEFQVKTFKMAV